MAPCWSAITAPARSYRLSAQRAGPTPPSEARSVRLLTREDSEHQRGNQAVVDPVHQDVGQDGPVAIGDEREGESEGPQLQEAARQCVVRECEQGCGQRRASYKPPPLTQSGEEHAPKHHLLDNRRRYDRLECQEQ